MRHLEAGMHNIISNDFMDFQTSGFIHTQRFNADTFVNTQT